MTLDNTLFYIFAAISILYVLHFGFYLIGANLYDIWQARRHFHRQLDAALGHIETYEPLVSLLIPAHNEEAVIERCLRSVLQSNYSQLQIIVIDDASTDTTAATVRRFIRAHPQHNLRLVRKRKNAGKGEALNYALRRYAKGELIMTLDADSILLHDTVSNAVLYFHDPDIVGVAANVHIIEEWTLLGMLQKFEHMIGYRSKKVYSLCNCEFVVGGVASTYRMASIRKIGFYDTTTQTEDIGLSIKVVNEGNRRNKVIYGADVVAATEGVLTLRALMKQRYRWKYGSLQNIVKYRHLIGSRDERYTRSLTLYRMPMAVISEFALLLSPLAWGYVLYLTVMQQSSALVLGAYMTITAYVLITVWSAENLTIRDRLRLCVYAPTAYFIFYIMDFVQFVAVCRCLAHIWHLVRQKDTKSTWISPKRVGREVVLR
jgi:cellulose synthase/poly-beta-1,6-N-acetylglucosamine synthase-like glycosyltransferase